MRTYSFISCFFFVFLLSYQVVPAQELPGDGLPPTLFNQLYTQNDSMIRVTIETDIKQMTNQKMKEEYQKATITLQLANGGSATYDIKIKARGNRRKEVCFYPPLKLKFKKSDLEQNGLQPFNELKFVTQCRDTKICGNYIFKEYIGYKLYNMVSPYSLRAQLIDVTFVDTRGKGKTHEMKGFIIEPLEELADRHAAQIVERSTMRTVFMELDPFQKMGIFEYMIGNTDWAVGNSHNLRFVKIPEYEKLVPIPYDFDYSGLVNTDYAVPFNTLPIKSVTERLYRGVECTDEEIPALIDYFKALEEPIMSYAEQFPHLTNLDHKELLAYLESFFRFLESPRSVKAALGSK